MKCKACPRSAYQNSIYH